MSAPPNAPSDHESLFFADEAAPSTIALPQPPWRVLVVDDDAEVLAITRIALNGAECEGRPLQLLFASSATEALLLLQTEPEIALLLLDVVMESEHAGLDLVRSVREQLGNRSSRIVLRTGQPGQVPPIEVFRRYQIDDYTHKAELGFDRLNLVVASAIRAYALLQENAEQARALTAQNAALSGFAQTVGNDLLEPLQQVLTFGDRLSAEGMDQLSERGREYLALMHEGAATAVGLVEALMRFHRIGAQLGSPEVVDLNRCMQDAQAALSNRPHARNAQWQLGTLPIVQGHPALLTQLLVELLDNALKYQPVPRPVASVSAQLKGTSWEIRVEDQGIGIEAQKTEAVMQPFTRLHSRDHFPGAGLGLASCVKIARLHGGSVHVERSSKKGTTVLLQLPAIATELAPH